MYIFKDEKEPHLIVMVSEIIAQPTDGHTRVYLFHHAWEYCVMTANLSEEHYTHISLCDNWFKCNIISFIFFTV